MEGAHSKNKRERERERERVRKIDGSIERKRWRGQRETRASEERQRGKKNETRRGRVEEPYGSEKKGRDGDEYSKGRLRKIENKR